MDTARLKTPYRSGRLPSLEPRAAHGLGLDFACGGKISEDLVVDHDVGEAVAVEDVEHRLERPVDDRGEGGMSG